MLRIIIAMAAACVVSILASKILELVIADASTLDAVSAGLGVLIGAVGMIGGLIWDTKHDNRW